MNYEDIRTPADAMAFIEVEIFHGRDKEKVSKISHVIRKLFIVEQLKLNGNVVDNIIKSVCTTTGINKSILSSKCRKRELTWTRYFIWYMLKLNTDLSSTVMGNLFCRDHATALHGIREVKNKLDIKDSVILYNLIKIKSFFQENNLDIDNGL